jgi:hypothetical protein
MGPEARMHSTGRWIVFSFLAWALLPTPRAEAFCGFFVAGSNEKLTNNASQVAIVRKGNKTALSMSNTYKGPPESFAMVVPVPVVLKKEDVKTLPMNVFEHIDALSAPRLVEYWERDPCAPDEPVPPMSAVAGGAPPTPSPKGGAAPDRGVKIEAQFTVGEYEILILSAKESGGLELWLRERKYTIPQGAAEALAPYVRDKMKFFVAKVDIKKVKKNEQGVIQLSPLRVTYEAQELRLPVRLGLLNAEAKQDLIVYLLHPSSRFEVANYPNVFIPTNLEVTDAVRNDFAAFYAELFDATLAPRQGKAVVTEYAWQTTSCDPCPTEPLQPQDLVTLGGDLGSDGQGYHGGWNGYGYSPWVLTRLHARYDRTSLSDDLIFREAKPAWGGRANWDGQSADAGAKIQESGGTNNFQGRYIIRHYWEGKVACANPRYGQWGGPPGSSRFGTYQPPASAAKGLALAQRGKVTLKSAVRSPVPTLGLPGQPPPRRKN